MRLDRFEKWVLLAGGAVTLVIVMVESATYRNSSAKPDIPEESAIAKEIHSLENDRAFLSSKAGKIWKKHSIWSRAECEAIAAHKIAVGMDQEQVTLSWGKPERVNRTTFASQVDEQWVYGFNYVYFTNGLVKAISTSSQ